MAYGEPIRPLTAVTPDRDGHGDVIAGGAFGDQPVTVPLRAGQNGPVIGTATVHPDGTATLAIPERHRDHQPGDGKDTDPPLNS